MAGFARLGEPLGRPAETFPSACLQNRKGATGSSLDDSPIARVLIESAEIGGLRDWTLLAAEMLEELRQGRHRSLVRSPLWPKTPTVLSNQLHHVLYCVRHGEPRAARQRFPFQPGRYEMCRS